MSHYGCTVTKAGRELLAKLMAIKQPLVITNVMVGSGKCPNEIFPSDLTNLIQPIAQGTSTVPTYSGDTINMTVEYRSDMNGGLQQGFWLNEFSIHAQDPDGGQIMLFYGTLGDYPVWVSAFVDGTVDVRRFPVSITIGEGAEVQVNYNPGSFMTAADVDEVMNTAILKNAAVISATKEGVALNRSTLGYQRKNLLKNTLADGTYYGIDIMNTDGIIVANGTNTQDIQATISLGTVNLMSGDNVILNGCPSNGNLASYSLQIRSADNTVLANDFGEGSVSVTISTSGTYNILLRVAANYSIDGSLTFKPMLRYADITDDIYEPYVDDLQTQVNSIETIVDSALVSGANITGSDDLDTVTKSGQYKYSGSPANRPGTQTYGVLTVYNPMNNPYQGSSTYAIQVALAGVNAAHFGIASSAGVYVRTTANGGTTWSAWYKLQMNLVSAETAMAADVSRMTNANEPNGGIL